MTEGGTTVPGLNVLSNDTDPDESPPDLTAKLLTAPSLDPGFILNIDGTFTYTHDGSETLTDSFTYEACDRGVPPLCSLPTTVTITVDSVNDAPVIDEQLNPLSTPEETAIEILLADLQITDPDSAPATFVLSVLDGANYTRVDNKITPILDFNGDLTVPVTVSDGEDTSDVFNVTVVVTPVNDAPVITGQVPLSTPEDMSLTVVITDLTVADPDPEDVFPTDFTLELQPGLNYTLAGNTLTPDANFNGMLSVPATVSDGALTSAVFNLAIDVSAENDDPVLVGPIIAPIAVENSPYSLNVSSNFTRSRWRYTDVHSNRIARER